MTTATVTHNAVATVEDGFGAFTVGTVATVLRSIARPRGERVSHNRVKRPVVP